MERPIRYPVASRSVQAAARTGRATGSIPQRGITVAWSAIPAARWTAKSAKDSFRVGWSAASAKSSENWRSVIRTPERR